MSFTSQPILLTAIILLIYLQNVESSLNQNLCFWKTANMNETAVFDTYKPIIETMTSLQFDTTSDCTPTTLPAVNNEIHDCFNCTLQPTTTLDETSRYSMLYAINGDINSITTNPALSSSLGYITYASADHAAANSRCTQYSYPRICRLDLAALSIGTPPTISETFHFTLALNTTSGIASYEIQYDGTNGNQTWFGVGFGPQGMVGDAAVFTSGIQGEEPLQINDYNLTGEASGSDPLWKDTNNGGTNDFFDHINSLIDGEWIATAKRAMNTNDINDHVFTGTEESVPIFAAAGIASEGKFDQSHGKIRFIRSIDILFVPSPEASDTKWCRPMIVGNCTIPVNPAQTDNPTTNPTKTPTNMPSMNPSKMPSKMPTNMPSIAPTMKTADNANQIRLFVVFTVVIIATYSN